MSGLDDIDALFERAQSGEANDPRRADALLRLEFLLARQRLEASRAAERVSQHQLDVARAQARFTYWTALASGLMVVANFLLVIATVVLIYVGD